MKKIILVALMAVLSACEVVVVEPAIDPRDAIVGSYEVEEYSETYRQVTYYDIHLHKSGRGSRLYLGNFYGIGITVRAEYRNGRLTIPWQLVQGYEVEGAGTFSRGHLRFQFTITDTYTDTVTDFCEAEAWAQ
jgi:hypothetical protein